MILTEYQIKLDTNQHQTIFAAIRLQQLCGHTYLDQ